MKPTKETKKKGGRKFGHKVSEETRKKISAGHVGKIPWNKGKKMSIEYRRRCAEINKGDKCRFWKGGVSKENKRLRETLEYKLWRESVFKRDNYTCVWCCVRGCELNADHIKPFALYPELRFAIDNGRTLCVPCHKTTDTYGTPQKAK